VHPDLGIPLAHFWSGKSRGAMAEEHYLGDDHEWLVSFCKDYLKEGSADYFVFGHRHLVIDLPLGSSRYLNLGEWFKTSRCLEFKGQELSWREI
jgi:UDP-2,3-diacylglucosamine hydrolase